jgi:GTPase Era involved in 16S rRNA processing
LSLLAHESELHGFTERHDRAQERIRDLLNPLLIMVVGEGKFGKSSLINALTGAEVAPVSIVPKTWKVDLYEAVEGAENAVLSWRRRPDKPEIVTLSEAREICSCQEQQAQVSKAQEISWKSDLYQAHWRIKAPWPPAGVALVDTPGFSQFRLDSGVRNTFLYGSKGIVFEASDAFKYYFYRADVVLWCIRSDKLEDQDTLEMLNSAGERGDIVGILTHMDKVRRDRWTEVETKARQKFDRYLSRFMFSALGPKGCPELSEEIRRFLETEYIANKEDSKSKSVRVFLDSERHQFLSDVDGILNVYATNFRERKKIFAEGDGAAERLAKTAFETMEDIVKRYYNRALAKLDSLWDSCGGDIEQFEALVRNNAAEPAELFGDLSRITGSTAGQALAAANLLLMNVEWKGVRLNSSAPARVFNSHISSRVAESSGATFAALRTTFTGTEGVGAGLASGAAAAGVGALLLGPFGLVAGLFGLLVGALTKRSKCLAKAREALENCYKENMTRQLEVAGARIQAIFTQAEQLIDDSLSEHHGKDIEAVFKHAVLADQSCNALQLWPSRLRIPGPAAFGRDRQIFESCYLAALAPLAPEIASAWDATCSCEWGHVFTGTFSPMWLRGLGNVSSLRTREQAIASYAPGLAARLLSVTEECGVCIADPRTLLNQCTIEQDIRSALPSFDFVLQGCDTTRLQSLKSFTGIDYPRELRSEYDRRVAQAFASSRPNVDSETFKRVRPGCLFTVAGFIAFIALSSSETTVGMIGLGGFVVTVIGYYVWKSWIKKRAYQFSAKAVGTFYDRVLRDIKAATHDDFQRVEQGDRQ